MKKTTIAAAAVALTMAATTAHAVDLRPLIGMGLTHGGDTVGQGTYQNGDTAKIRGGGLIAFTGGFELRTEGPLSAQLLLSYHFDRANGDNGSMRFSRMPIELLGHYRLNEAFRLGGGLRYSTGAKIRASGVLSSGGIANEDFEPALGAVIEGEFLPAGGNLGLKVRVVSEKYESKTYPLWEDVDGTHVGAYLMYYFN